MKIRLLFLLVLLNSGGVWAQDITYATIKTGLSVKDVLGPTDIYYYAQFMPAKVYFRDGAKSAALMNYSTLVDQILFIDPKGDTLALLDGQTIKYISMDKDTFYFHEGYLRHVAGNSSVKLAERRVWELADIRKIGSHNRPATTYAVNSYSSLIDIFGKSHELIMNEDVVLRKKSLYFFGDNYYSFTHADKKNFLGLFPKQEERLSDYIKENKVKFDNGEDLKNLVQFLGQIQ